MKCDNTDNTAANKMLCVFAVVGVVPLIVVFLFFLFNRESPLISELNTYASNSSSLFFLKKEQMTKIMGWYLNSSPLLAFFLFVFSFKKRSLVSEKNNRNKLIRACIFGPFLYFFYIYFILFAHIELTGNIGLSKTISNNDVFLLLFYMGIYFSLFLLTYAILYMPAVFFNILKRRL